MSDNASTHPWRVRWEQTGPSKWFDDAREFEDESDPLWVRHPIIKRPTWREAMDAALEVVRSEGGQARAVTVRRIAKIAAAQGGTR